MFKKIGVNEVLNNRCKKYTKNINLRVSGTSNGKTIMLSKRVMCGSKKSRFIKNQKAKGLLSNLGLRTPLSIR